MERRKGGGGGDGTARTQTSPLPPPPPPRTLSFPLLFQDFAVHLLVLCVVRVWLRVHSVAWSFPPFPPFLLPSFANPSLLCS